MCLPVQKEGRKAKAGELLAKGKAEAVSALPTYLRTYAHASSNYHVLSKRLSNGPMGVEVA
jgi:hypothetical protein